MAKKKNRSGATDKTANPFSTLKGFAVSEQPRDLLPTADKPVAGPNPELEEVDFAERMIRMGVRPFDTQEPVSANPDERVRRDDSSQRSTEEQVFLEAMQHLQGNFADSFAPDNQEELSSRHNPRRMKQVAKGTLVPQATLDLHGARRQNLADRLSAFIDTARYRGHCVLLIITGKGLHSDEGKGILRPLVEEYLATKGREHVAEWGVAPRRYGGDGALVVFLRQPQGKA